MAAGKHYASPREFPVVCGMDGVGDPVALKRKPR